MSGNLTVSAGLCPLGNFASDATWEQGDLHRYREGLWRRISTATSVLGQSRHFAARRSLPVFPGGVGAFGGGYKSRLH
jgi:hypothetical protein